MRTQFITFETRYDLESYLEHLGIDQAIIIEWSIAFFGDDRTF